MQADFYSLYPQAKNPPVSLETYLQEEAKMSNDQQDDPALKFWNNSDFMEKLLPFLDAQSTLSLARSKISCTLDILQNKENPSIWRKMVKRSLPDNFRIEKMPTEEEV